MRDCTVIQNVDINILNGWLSFIFVLNTEKKTTASFGLARSQIKTVGVSVQRVSAALTFTAANTAACFWVGKKTRHTWSSVFTSIVVQSKQNGKRPARVCINGPLFDVQLEMSRFLSTRNFQKRQRCSKKIQYRGWTVNTNTCRIHYKHFK